MYRPSDVKPVKGDATLLAGVHGAPDPRTSRTGADMLKWSATLIARPARQDALLGPADLGDQGVGKSTYGREDHEALGRQA